MYKSKEIRKKFFSSEIAEELRILYEDCSPADLRLSNERTCLLVVYSWVYENL